jgi:hypothetical protein
VHRFFSLALSLVCVTEVNGSIVDELDAPVEGVLMTVCGPGGCEPDTSDASGNYAIEVGFALRADDFSLRPHARELGKMVHYVPLAADEPGPVVSMAPIRLLDVPAGGEALTAMTDNAGAPAQTVSHGDLTLDVPAGVRVSLAFEDVVLGDEGKLFRARRVPDALLGDFVDTSLGVVALYAMTPFDTRFDLDSDPTTAAKVRLTVANSAGLAADSAVQFLQLGSFVVGDLEAGDYLPVASGRVSSDGTTITMDAGEGITTLTWIALRPAP